MPKILLYNYTPNYNFYSSMHEINMCPIVKFVCMYTTHHMKCLLCL